MSDIDDRVAQLVPLARYHAEMTRRRFDAMGNPVTLNDAMSGALNGAWLAAQSWEPEGGSSITSWAYPYVRREATTAAYKALGLTRRGDGLVPDELSTETHGLPVVELDVDARIDVHRAVRKLPTTLRLVVWFVYWCGYKLREVAQTLGCGYSTVKRYHVTALATLRGMVSTA